MRETGYLTPDEVPDARSRRAFLVPTDPAWFGLLMGALAPLLNENAWRKFGELTPEECAQIWLELFFSNPGCGCELPGGGEIIRINPTTGHLEELQQDEEGNTDWVAPSGDYAVPDVPARSGGTSADQICLAAANAANVYQQLYENITDSVAGHLDEAEAYTALVALFITLVGWEFAPIAFALAAFFLAVFGAIYAVVGFLTADVWDSDFTNNLICVLVGCASNDDGVVTFDWDCIKSSLPAATGGLTEDGVRLLGQLLFIFQVTGGIDGINLAGATTAITDASCDFCDVHVDMCIQTYLGNSMAANLVNVEANLYTVDAVYYEPLDVWYCAVCSCDQQVFKVSSIDYTTGTAFESDLQPAGGSGMCDLADMSEGFDPGTAMLGFQYIGHEFFALQFAVFAV